MSTIQFNDEIKIVRRITPFLQQAGVNADRLRWALGKAEPYDVVEVPNGMYALGADPLYLPNKTMLVSKSGPESVLLTSAKEGVFGPKMGCGIELGNGCIIDGITMQAATGLDKQTCLVGIGRTDAPTDNFVGTIRNSIVNGRDWGIYHWAGVNITINVFNTIVNAGRKVIYLGNSSGDKSGFFNLDSCIVNAFSNLSTYPGDGGPQLSGLGARGGVVTARNCQVNVIGLVPMQLIAGAWVDPAGMVGASVVLIDTHVNVQAPAGIVGYDMLTQGYGLIKQRGGSGSLPGGRWVGSGSIDYHVYNQGA